MADNLICQVQLALAEGDFDTVFEQYDEALRSGRTEVKVGYAFLLWQYYEYPRASELFRELTSEPDLPRDILLAIAKCQFRQARFAAAAETMELAVRRWPNDPNLWHQFASCCERSDRFNTAREACERGLMSAPWHQGLARQLAHVERRQDNLEAAICRLEQFLVEFPWVESWQVRYELAACYDRIGEYCDAWNQLLKAKLVLREQSLLDLKESYRVRRRQAEVTNQVSAADLSRWSRLNISQPRRLALLAGFPRSGTTLLETMLSAHPEVQSTDESGVLVEQFVRPLIRDAESASAALIELRSFDQDQIMAGRNHYFRCTENVIGERLDEHLLIEKDPLLTCDLAIPLRLFPEARFIMPLRDPRDVVLSYYFTMLPFAWNSAPATDIVESAKFYSDVIYHWLNLRQRLPWDWHEVRYEKLVGQPELELERLTSFLGIESTDSMLDHEQRRRAKPISTPTYDDIGRPIYLRSAGRWHHYEEQLAPAMPVLAPLFRHLGY